MLKIPRKEGALGSRLWSRLMLLFIRQPARAASVDAAGHVVMDSARSLHSGNLCQLTQPAQGTRVSLDTYVSGRLLSSHAEP